MATIAMPRSSRARPTATTTSCGIRTTRTSGAGRAADVPIPRLGEEHFRVVTGAGYVNSDLGWLRIQMREGDPRVELRESTEDFSVIGMWGPSARDVLERVTGDDVSELAFPFMQAREIRVGGATALAQRVTYVGELGWKLYLDPAWAGQVWDRLMEAGHSSGIMAVRV